MGVAHQPRAFTSICELDDEGEVSGVMQWIKLSRECIKRMYRIAFYPHSRHHAEIIGTQILKVKTAHHPLKNMEKKKDQRLSDENNIISKSS